MASLKLTYKDVWQKVAEYRGLGSSPSGSDLIKVKYLTKRGYRKFLMPLDASTGKYYKWKFLEKTTTLSTEVDENTYDLPEGFSSFVIPFTNSTPIAWNPIEKTLDYIYQLKSQQTSSGYPRYFALQSGEYNENTGQRYKVIFEPTPSASLTYYYTYVYDPPEPVNDDDYFVGGAVESEAILQCALAAAELDKHDEPRGQSQQADVMLQMLIGKDKQANVVRNMGQMADGKTQGFVRSAIVYLDDEQVLPE